MHPKVLIVSHNVFGLNGNMGKTLHAYFEKWPKEKLCQVYFHSEVPTTHLCERYFRVTDVDMVWSLCHLKKSGTALIAKDIEENRVTTRTDVGRTAEIYQKASERKPWMYFARNALWRFGFWKSKQMDQWIRDCAPDVIFYASGDYTFSYEIALYISKKYDLPLVVSVVDDYYFQRPLDKGPLAWWNTMRFRKVMEKTMAHAKGVFYIHPVMEKMYRERFPVNSAVLYKNAPICELDEPEDENVKIAYFGGLGLQRNQSMIEIGRLLRKLIPDGSVLLDVYSAESRPEILARMTEENGIRFHGQVSADEVIRLQAESNILVFAESMDPTLVERLRCSLSTKIPEYLGSNRCMLAYGPAEAGSISYLLDKHVACVATKPEQLESCLRGILFSAQTRRQYAEGQMELALKNHGQERNHEVLKNIIQTAMEG